MLLSLNLDRGLHHFTYTILVIRPDATCIRHSPKKYMLRVAEMNFQISRKFLSQSFEKSSKLYRRTMD